MYEQLALHKLQLHFQKNTIIAKYKFLIIFIFSFLSSQKNLPLLFDEEKNIELFLLKKFLILKYFYSFQITFSEAKNCQGKKMELMKATLYLHF